MHSLVLTDDLSNGWTAILFGCQMWYRLDGQSSYLAVPFFFCYLNRKIQSYCLFTALFYRILHLYSMFYSFFFFSSFFLLVKMHVKMEISSFQPCNTLLYIYMLGMLPCKKCFLLVESILYNM